MRELKKTPNPLVVDGKVQDYGLFADPFENMNILEAQIYPGKNTPRFIRHARLKQWQHWAIINKEFFMAFAVVDAGYMGASFCYIVDRKTGQITEYHKQAPGPATKTSKELFNDNCRFVKNGYGIEIKNRLSKGLHHISVGLRGSKKQAGIYADLTAMEDLDKVQPLITVLPIDENRPLHTHKAAFPVKGEISLGDKKVILDPEQDIAIIDVQKTYYPYNTFWKWATGAGYNTDGKLIAFNLVSNMIKDDENFNENVLWVDGELTPLASARFGFDNNDFTKPWHLSTSKDNQLEIDFTPMGKRAEKINLGIMISDYHQPYGLMSGTATDINQNSIEFENIFGVTEHHRARF